MCCMLLLQDVLSMRHELFQEPKVGGFGYVVPRATDIETYRKCVDLMPAIEGPEIFGLHKNADLTCRTLQVHNE